MYILAGIFIQESEVFSSSKMMQHQWQHVTVTLVALASELLNFPLGILKYLWIWTGLNPSLYLPEVHLTFFYQKSYFWTIYKTGLDDARLKSFLPVILELLGVIYMIMLGGEKHKMKKIFYQIFCPYCLEQQLCFLGVGKLPFQSGNLRNNPLLHRCLKG